MIAVMLEIMKLRIVVQSAAWVNCLCADDVGVERRDMKQRSRALGCKREGSSSPGDAGGVG